MQALVSPPGESTRAAEGATHSRPRPVARKAKVTGMPITFHEKNPYD